MAFKRGFFRGDKKKLFSGIMCIGFGLFFFVHAFLHGFTTSIFDLSIISFLFFTFLSLIHITKHYYNSYIKINKGEMYL